MYICTRFKRNSINVIFKMSVQKGNVAFKGAPLPEKKRSKRNLRIILFIMSVGLPEKNEISPNDLEGGRVLDWGYDPCSSGTTADSLSLMKHYNYIKNQTLSFLRKCRKLKSIFMSSELVH